MDLSPPWEQDGISKGKPTQKWVCCMSFMGMGMSFMTKNFKTKNKDENG